MRPARGELGRAEASREAGFSGPGGTCQSGFQTRPRKSWCPIAHSCSVSPAPTSGLAALKLLPGGLGGSHIQGTFSGLRSPRVTGFFLPSLEDRALE